MKSQHRESLRAPGPSKANFGRPLVVQGRFQPSRFHSSQPVAQAGVLQPKLANAYLLPQNALTEPHRHSGQALEKEVRQRMESFFKADFSDVRIHEDNTAASIGAAAFTMSNHVFFARGQYLPRSTAGLELLGHELAHVVQQRQGRVRNPFGKGAAVVNDLGLEAEADRMGRMAARHILGTQARTVPVTALPPNQMLTRQPAGATIQPKVRVGDVDYHWKYWGGSEAESLWKTVLPVLDKKQLLPDAAKRWMRTKLKEWVDAGATISVVSARFGYWAQDRRYKDMDELATALIGEYMQNENRQRETRMAAKMAGNTKINADMVKLMKRLHAVVLELIQTSSHSNAKNLHQSINAVQHQNKKLFWNIPNPVASAWTWWKPWFSTVMAELGNPKPGYHLNYTYFRIACYKVESVLGIRIKKLHIHDRNGNVLENPADFRYNEFNMIEAHEFAQTARLHKIPIMSGPSNTMARLLRVCENIKASDDEIKALLWTAFIFHNKHFFSDRTLTHTFHEIFDVTAEFNINSRLNYTAQAYERYLAESEL